MNLLGKSSSTLLLDAQNIFTKASESYQKVVLAAAQEIEKSGVKFTRAKEVFKTAEDTHTETVDSASDARAKADKAIEKIADFLKD